MVYNKIMETQKTPQTQKEEKMDRTQIRRLMDHAEIVRDAAYGVVMDYKKANGNPSYDELPHELQVVVNAWTMISQRIVNYYTRDKVSPGAVESLIRVTDAAMNLAVDRGLVG